MEASASEMVFSRDFFLSSAESSSLPQYSSLESSSSCSVFRVETISSIILITLSKLGAPPWRDSAIMATRGSLEARAAPRARSAAVLVSREWAEVCSSVGDGRVFLKSSSASSSLRILMVSARASSSSARVLHRASHSASFVAQLFFSSARNAWSSLSASEVSSLSLLICAIETASSPDFWIFSSIILMRALDSAVFAPMSSLKMCWAFSSACVASASVVAISSPSCFSRPTISVDPAAE
mmetsp:Transcript_55628/g.154943  ORF Transcript_55628/g.154943 Transcript_55628/m.154943 type:complete len:240 (+) Transcript_55628:910-1629(+)